MIGTGLSLTQIAVNQLVGRTPSTLFAAGEQGAWYDPSDFRTMFQDAAGATPVTAVEQPVGRILDKSGRGNHATQTTSTSRPVLSARVNLLTKTEQFDDAAWAKANATITANSVVAPDGTATADKLEETATTGAHDVSRSGVGSAAAHVFSVCMKAAERTWGVVRIDGASTFFDLANGAVGTSAAGNTGAITPLGDGWFRCAVTRTLSGSSFAVIRAATGNGVESYAGVIGSGIYVWGASLVPANQASLPYQRVNTSTDYDTAGFPLYLRFDGVDDFLVTNSINFTATDKMTVFAGVRKLSDAAAGILLELGSSGGVSGAFSIGSASAAGDAARRTWFMAQEASATETTGAAKIYVSPDTRVFTGVWDRAQSTQIDEMVLRLNGAQQSLTFSVANLASGSFGNNPLYIGRRGGTTLPFNGHLYSLIVRGEQSNAGQIGNAEQWVNSVTKAY